MAQEKKTIAICTGKINDEITTLIIQEIYDKCIENGYHVEVYAVDMTFIFDSEFGDAKEKDLFEIIPYENIAGIFAFSDRLRRAGVMKKITAKAKAYEIPIVCLEDNEEDSINVFFDTDSTFGSVINHVIEEHSCKKIYFVAGLEGNEVSDARIAVFKESLESHGIDYNPDYVVYGDFWSEPARNQTRNLIVKYGIPDAICCANDAMAIAVSDALTEMGYSVPGDVIVTGFDGLKGAFDHLPSITTVGPYYEKLAIDAFSAINDVITQKVKYEPRDISVSGKLIIGESCGCKPLNMRAFKSRMSKMYEQDNQNDFHEIILMKAITKVASKSNLKEAVKCFEEPLSVMMDVDYFYVCIWDNYIGANLNRRQNRRHAIVVASMVNEEYSTCETNLSSGVNLPNYDKIMEKDSMLMYYPLKAANEFFGYLAFGINPTNYKREKLVAIGRYFSVMCTIFLQQTRLNSAYKRLEEAYSTDTLTGILNRRGFLDRLEPMRLVNNDKKGVLISVDLNNLKTINDTWGHLEGDEALRAMADALKDACPKGSLVARFGGDEFVVFYASNKSDERIIERFSERLEEAIEETNDTLDKPYYVYASYGINITSLDREYDFDANYSDADAKMYANKIEFKKTHSIIK